MPVPSQAKQTFSPGPGSATDGVELVATVASGLDVPAGLAHPPNRNAPRRMTINGRDEQLLDREAALAIYDDYGRHQ